MSSPLLEPSRNRQLYSVSTFPCTNQPSQFTYSSNRPALNYMSNLVPAAFWRLLLIRALCDLETTMFCPRRLDPSCMEFDVCLPGYLQILLRDIVVCCSLLVDWLFRRLEEGLYSDDAAQFPISQGSCRGAQIVITRRGSSGQSGIRIGEEAGFGAVFV